jgi:large subunit ribosomal protein L29
MDAKTIGEMTDDELAAEVAAQSEMLFKYRFQLATGQIENPAKIRAVRRQIARLKTAQRARQIKAHASA